MHYQIYEFYPEHGVDKEILNIILKIGSQIPEFGSEHNIQKLESRLTDKICAIIIAYDNQLPVAYKIGYALSSYQFYSWLGAVVPKYRKKGIADAMLQQQESWVIDHNYNTISVRSMNRFPAMLHMLISRGYHISGYIDNGTSDNSKVCFIKDIRGVQ
ncbi:GNAT family N-acetyltransferase [Agarilytica rhodophyticola]|uniref:GNAT family N-acetyltransferase n=1 Tax=Agarilytica rhodophyticola TaxID=1737490 RepID=UPI001C1F6ED0|nr:GNAT family N-acetyltransferase [Agarilytica rhodophyticola]